MLQFIMLAIPILASWFSLSIVILLSFFSLCYFYFKSKSSKTYKFPPGPAPLPLIGNLHLLNMKNPDISLTQLSEKYGTIYTFHMGTKKFVVLTGYDTVKDALTNHAEEFGDRGHVPIFEKSFSNYGIIFSRGESWKQMRRFALSTLRDFGMGKKTIEHRILEETAALIKVFESFKGQPFESTLIMNNALANIICSVVFGQRFEYDDEKFIRLLKVINESIKLGGTTTLRLYNAFPFLGFLPGAHKKIIKLREDLNREVAKMLTESKSTFNHSNLRSFADAFIVRQEIEAKNEATHFHDENLLFTTQNLFGAGTETTSTTLRWGILLLAKYPDIQKKVQDEIDRIIGPVRPPAVEDRKNMPYCNAVIHELQRFGNIVPMNLQHETAMDTHFRGYFLPKGTQVIPLLTSVLRDKTQWKTPYLFNPSHFLNTEGQFIKHDAFMPFSAGRRACIGENLARMELFLFFVALLQKFTFRPPPGVTEKDLDLEPRLGITNSPKSLLLCAVPR
ncbi:cytochrome P450 2K6-like [Protopterus annectens]|uniref:cytochrome P450 2K6-like n=1 Tax=Protopterus annectens TaxID=7888 RepID=UPI001CFB505D|nr:cytochrome P450 2K6-like [Protopterus annectens]